jgi:2-dehydro-3-deoxyphosphogluconate aldolase/(4S)-4-hydroxy-2-oxoglutarate aldolase
LDKSWTLDLIQTTRLIAIMRGNFVDRYSEVVAALSQAGVAAVEVSLVSADAYKILTRLVEVYGSYVAIGAGTVTTVEQVERVHDCGVNFVISPNLREDVIEATLRNELVSMPGAYTPSEIARASELGADAVKLFPASSLGPSFVRAVRGPFPNLRLVPTGGVGLTEIPLYLNAGAWAVAAGSELVTGSRLTDQDLLTLHERARAFAAAARGERIG